MESTAGLRVRLPPGVAFRRQLKLWRVTCAIIRTQNGPNRPLRLRCTSQYVSSPDNVAKVPQQKWLTRGGGSTLKKTFRRPTAWQHKYDTPQKNSDLNSAKKKKFRFSCQRRTCSKESFTSKFLCQQNSMDNTATLTVESARVCFEMELETFHARQCETVNKFRCLFFSFQVG